MNKKVIMLVGFVMVLLISIQYFDATKQKLVVENDTKPKIADLLSDQNVMPMSTVSSPPQYRPWPEAKSAKEVIVNEQLLQKGQSEISALIDQYDENLSDPVKRHEIEQLVLKKAVSYKKEVLAKVKSLQ